jgi:phosphoheptose isomerase
VVKFFFAVMVALQQMLNICLQNFLVRLRPHVNRKPFPVISLALDTSTITACGNDLGFEQILRET